ncbi:glutamate receptor ionotropic, delta-1-like [Schistocerca gregaria]|uniref:glutamate receptor ionotropic, delta-1-like n=1 Tax=Schistocerca gregaria TaxID=7010 RepID=UPI00211EB7EF|nr:glutamate receptor ionotropic, delta-1-like [Schistocerca gregaria]
MATQDQPAVRGHKNGYMLYDNLNTFDKIELRMLFVYRVLVFVPVTQGKIIAADVCIYSWPPFDINSHCPDTSAAALQIHRWSNISFTQWKYDSQPLGHDLFNNLGGCPVRVIAVPFPPFILKESFHTNGYRQFAGMEINLLNEISKAMNFSIHYVKTTLNNKDRGVLLPNGSWTGVLGQIKRREADIAAFTFAINIERYKYFDFSAYHLIDEFHWVVPRAIQKAEWKNLVIVFSPALWVLVVISLVAFSLLARLSLANSLMLLRETFPTFLCVLKMLAILLGSSNGDNHRLSIRKYIIIPWILACIILNASYQTTLISALTKPGYEYQVSTEEDILHSGMRIELLPVFNYYFSNLNDPTESEISQRKINIADLPASYNRTASSKNIATVSSRQFWLYHGASYLDEQQQPLLYAFKSAISFSLHGLLMPRGSPLKPNIDAVIKSIRGSGLLNKWLHDVNQRNLLQQFSHSGETQV